ncbi:Ankyrin-3 [Araneus ventricosus]|uniref:Ankyrin-3 n=1 Tax=Araneus ventricosus TaxID=182803 RepID=A0A4Y2BJ48_ARAVE|nr:Ankyrin-3 [Araneus ventricosus]
MSVTVPSIHHHILFHRHGYGLNLSHQFPNYREDPNACNSYGTTPLHVLCLTNDYCEVADELIKSGAQVNAANHFGSTPLHFAVIHRNEWMVRVLIEHGADVNLQDMNGNAALHFAVRNSKTLLYLPEHQTGDLWIVQKLINNGADIDIFNKDYETPLMWAIREDGMDIVKELLAFGANVNTRKDGLETCLHVASRNIKPNSDIIIELVKHGACINCLDQDGKTALDVLLQSRNPGYGFKSAKALIKVATLMNFEHEINFRVTKESLTLNEFIRKCSEEVLSMKSIVYAEKFSLCHFALNGGYNINHGNPSEESIFDKVLDTLSNYTFPIYHDILAANFERSYLCEKVQKLNIYARNERGYANISLNHDVISKISCSLSDGDLINFIRAYTKSVVPLSDDDAV